MVDEKQLLAALKTYLPDADESTYLRMADEIKQDMEAEILSRIRQAVAHERQENYKQALRG